MTKEYTLPSSIKNIIFSGEEKVGHLWGCSQVLKDLKETILIEGEINNPELFSIYNANKIVGNEWVKICLVDWKLVKSIAPTIYSIFEKQFYDFQEKISLTQRFQSI